MTTEPQEIARALIRFCPHYTTQDDYREFVRRRMPAESVTVIDGVAYELQRLHREERA